MFQPLKAGLIGQFCLFMDRQQLQQLRSEAFLSTELMCWEEAWWLHLAVGNTTSLTQGAIFSGNCMPVIYSNTPSDHFKGQFLTKPEQKKQNNSCHSRLHWSTRLVVVSSISSWVNGNWFDNEWKSMSLMERASVETWKQRGSMQKHLQRQNEKE